MRTKQNGAVAKKLDGPQPHTGDQEQQEQKKMQEAWAQQTQQEPLSPQAQQELLSPQAQQAQQAQAQPKKTCRTLTGHTAPAADEAHAANAAHVAAEAHAATESHAASATHAGRAAHVARVHTAAVNRPEQAPQPTASMPQPAPPLSQPATSLSQPAALLPLLPLPQGCVIGSFVQRRKRFSVELQLNGEELWVHSNNSGSMLGLTRPGSPVLVSPATNPARKLKYTQECVWLPQTARPTDPASATTSTSSAAAAASASPSSATSNAAAPARSTPATAPEKTVTPGNAAPSCAVPARSTPPSNARPSSADPAPTRPAPLALCALPGFWVGVNTNTPNRMLEAAFHAGRLDFAQGYTNLVREAKRGQSRLDGLITGPGLPPLWVECKNVTMVEDDAACFPDAASERGQKHLRELMDIVAQGERAAMLYLVQRPDGRCFAPADFIDPEYARLFYEALACGVEMYPYRALVSTGGIDLGGLIPLRPAL